MSVGPSLYSTASPIFCLALLPSVARIVLASRESKARCVHLDRGACLAVTQRPDDGTLRFVGSIDVEAIPCKAWSAQQEKIFTRFDLI